MHPLTLILSTLVAAGGSPAHQVAETAIVGAKIEIGDGRTIDNGTLVMRGSEIVLLGEGLAAPPGAKVIDGHGKTVYPGFVDAYSTSDLSLPDAPPSGKDLPDTTNTAPATMWHENRKNIRANVHAATALNAKASFADRLGQGVTTVLFSGGSGSLAGTAALVDLTETPRVLVPDAAEEFVWRSGRTRPRGEEMAGAQGRLPQETATTPTYAYPDTLFGVFGLMRQTLWDAKAYANEAKPKEDATYEGLRPLVTGRMPGLFTIENARDVTRAGHLADEFGFKMIVNGVPDAYRALDVIKAHAAPVIVSLDVPDAPSVKPGTSADSTPQRVLDDRLQQYKDRMANARTLDAAGVTIAFRKGSDDYLVGVRKLVKASGLSREAALRAMALNPAKMFGLSDKMGTLAVGRTANLVIMTGDFLDEKSKVTTTVVEGVATDAKKETAK